MINTRTVLALLTVAFVAPSARSNCGRLSLPRTTMFQ